MAENSFKNEILKNNTFKNIFFVISENYFLIIRVFLKIAVIRIFVIFQPS